MSDTEQDNLRKALVGLANQLEIVIGQFRAFQPTSPPVEQAGWPRYYMLGDRIWKLEKNALKSTVGFWLGNGLSYACDVPAIRLHPEEQISAHEALARIDEAKNKVQPSEPFVREPGWQYICTDDERKASMPRQESDQYWSESAWEWKESHWLTTEFGNNIYRRKLTPTKPVTAGEKSLGAVAQDEWLRQASRNNGSNPPDWNKVALAVIAAWTR